MASDFLSSLDFSQRLKEGNGKIFLALTATVYAVHKPRHALGAYITGLTRDLQYISIRQYINTFFMYHDTIL